ncbi:MAG: endolytic transglycosylase MltG [bacterium]
MIQDFGPGYQALKTRTKFFGVKIGTVFALAISVIFAIWYLYVIYLARGTGSFVDFEISQGESARVVAAGLAKKGIVKSELAFRIYLKLHGGGDRFQTGSFKLELGSGAAKIASLISSGSEASEKVLRVIEGWTLEDIGHEIERLGIGKREDFLKLTGRPATDYRELPNMAPSIDWAKEFPILADKPVYVSLEGYLFPDTYRFANDAKPVDVVRKLLKEFTRKFDSDMVRLAKDSKKSVFQIVTMASVIEREVNGDIDRAKVSDLLWRRYEINWALQCDSTVKYANQKNGETPFTTATDRASESEYNTYTSPGLPLGPISNPGMASILASLKPSKNEAWYFLTTPDGEVKYAKTLEEHNANKRYMR